MFKMFSMEFIEAIDQVLLFLSTWLVLTSFYEANWWHFTDPQTSGISISALILFLVCLFVSPVLLSIKRIRQFRANAICWAISKLLPSLLLLASSMPFFQTLPWVRTSLLGIGVALIPLFLIWLYSVRYPNQAKSTNNITNCSITDCKKTKFSNFDQNYSTKRLGFSVDDSFFSVNFLLAILLSMSIRYCSGTINIFYENWIFSTCLFLATVLLSIIRSVFSKEKVFCSFSESLKPPQSTESTVIRQEILNLNDNTNTKAMTELSEGYRLDDKINQFRSDSNNSKILDLKKCSFVEESFVSSYQQHWKYTIYFSILGSIQGIGLGVQLVLFLWFFSTPNLLWHWAGRNQYKDGILVLFMFAIGVVGSLVFRPEHTSFSLFSLNKAFKNKVTYT